MQSQGSAQQSQDHAVIAVMLHLGRALKNELLIGRDTEKANSRSLSASPLA